MVIDKVDKPEPPVYRVQATVEARGQRQQRQEEEKREGDEYSESAGIKGWQKYLTDAKDRRALKLRKQDISKIAFNQVILQRGLVIVDVDIRLVNGHLLKNAHIFSTKIDAYWKLKKIPAGTLLPVAQIISEQYLEVSVVHKEGTVKTEQGKAGPSVKSRTETGRPKSAGATGRPNWVTIAIYAIIFASIITTLIIIL